MSIRHEQREVARIYAYIDRLGYLWCGDCLPEGHVADRQEIARSWDQPCDHCRRDLRESTPVMETETVEIEYFTCKIF
jgi:hypothetical protein